MGKELAEAVKLTKTIYKNYGIDVDIDIVDNDDERNWNGTHWKYDMRINSQGHSWGTFHKELDVLQFIRGMNFGMELAKEKSNA